MSGSKLLKKWNNNSGDAIKIISHGSFLHCSVRTGIRATSAARIPLRSANSNIIYPTISGLCAFEKIFIFGKNHQIMINNFQDAQQDMRTAYGFGSTRYSNAIDY